MAIKSSSPSPSPSSSPSPSPSSGGLSEQQALNQIVGAGGGGTGSGRVYMGAERSVSYSPRGRSEGSTDIWMSKTRAENDFYTWSQKKISDFVSAGVVAGLLKPGDGPLEGASLWKKLVDSAAQYGAAGQKVAPSDLLATYVKASGGGNAWTSAGVWQVNTQTGERKYSGPGTYLGNGKARQTDSRVDLTDPDTAKAAATKVFQDMLGRDPGTGELGSFANALHTAEQNNPVVQTTTTQYDMNTGQALSTDTQSSGGVSADARDYMAEQQVKGSKEYGAYQAATTYQNALDSLVFGSSSGA